MVRSGDGELITGTIIATFYRMVRSGDGELITGTIITILYLPESLGLDLTRGVVCIIVFYVWYNTQIQGEQLLLSQYKQNTSHGLRSTGIL